ncbi:MAG: HlyD family efflux transporter periplasmic adaptor subunit [Planctomycetota bacterium]
MNSPTELPGSGVEFAGPMTGMSGSATSSLSPSAAPPNNTSQGGVTAEVTTLAAVVELIGLANRADDFEQACESMAHAMREWFRADSVDFSWQPRPGTTCRWVAGSTTSEEDPHTVTIRDAAANEVMMRGGVADSGALLGGDRIALLAVKRYCAATNAKRVLGLSFSESDVGQSSPRRSGSLLVRLNRPISENEAAALIRRLQTSQRSIGQTLDRIADSEPTALGRFGRSLSEWFQTRKLKFAACCILLLVVLLSIPLPYRIAAECELQPILRQYVASPTTAPLKSVNVRPGDDVRTGETLAILDAREIEMELAAKDAELKRVRQEQKGQIAQHEFAKSKLTALQVQRLQSETDLLEHRRQSLHLHAPIHGIVVTGDWKRSEGIVLERGETLFEIAPLGEFKIEVLVDESDVLSLRRGMPLQFRLDAMPGEIFRATIERIHPRAELREDQNRFVAEATIEDPDRRLRPGMRGRGYIEADQHPLAWNLFHKAYYRAAALLGGG